MLKLKTIAAIIAVLLSLSISTLAQTQAPSQTPPHFQIEPEAMELLKKVAEAYRNIKSYQLEGVEVWESWSTGNVLPHRIRFRLGIRKARQIQIGDEIPCGKSEYDGIQWRVDLELQSESQTIHQKISPAIAESRRYGYRRAPESRIPWRRSGGQR